jgi:hypothetical protein
MEVPMIETEVVCTRAEFERLLKGIETLVGDHERIFATLAENRAILDELRRLGRRVGRVEDEQEKDTHWIA